MTADLAVKPGLCRCPIALDHVHRGFKSRCSLLDSESAEKPELNNAGLAAVELFERVAAANPDARLIVTVPTGFASMDLFASPADWKIHRVAPLAEEAARQIFLCHGIPAPSNRTVRLLCSLTTLEAVSATAGS